MYNTSEINQLIKQFVQNNKSLTKNRIRPIALCIEGPHGIGKTTIIRDTAKELGMNTCYINLPQLSEVGDLAGFPYKEFEFCKPGTSDCEWVPERNIEAMIQAGYEYTHRSRQNYAVPSWVRDCKEGTILILDDFTRAFK